MERTITKSLLAWKNDPLRKPLVLTGVRQCGKTYSITEFGKSSFTDMAYFNFEQDASLASFFDYDLNPKRIISELGSIVRKKEIVPGQTLLVFDEIQACPKAITSLKYFCEELPSLHLIAAGSLLGVKIKQAPVSFPVGKVNRLTMYPMSFSEFVRANNRGSLLDALSAFALDRELPSAVTEPLEKLLQYYYIIGGMPEAVNAWLHTQSIDRVEQVQDDILRDYADDFGKHAPLSDIPKISMIWDAVPAQLAKDNNKFVFSHIKKGARAKDLEDALQWLIDAGLVYKLDLVASPELPLSFHADSTYFKVFFSDVGLLRRKAGVYYRTILDSSGQFVGFKGAMAENYVMSELVHLGLPHYFWRSGNTAELDFLTEYKGNIVPIEVKSSTNTRAKSMQQFCKKYTCPFGFKFSLKNIGDNMTGHTHIWSLPLYMVCEMQRYMDAEADSAAVHGQEEERL